MREMRLWGGKVSMVVAWEKGSPERSLALSVPMLLGFFHHPFKIQQTRLRIIVQSLNSARTCFQALVACRMTTRLTRMGN